jgi:hypothetical protein
LNGYSRLALVGALIATLLFGLAAVLFVQGGDASTRLALLFGLLGIALPSIIGLLKADAAATATDKTSSIATALDGTLDPRLRNAARLVAAEPKGSPTEAVVSPDPTVARVYGQ